MGLTDPKRLAILLEDLQKELARWAAMSSDMLEAATFGQRQSQELSIQTSRYARIVNTQMLEDKLTYQTRKEDVGTLIIQCQDAVEVAKVGLKEVEGVYAKTEQNLRFWREQLEAAQRWYERTVKRVDKAQSELVSAKSALSNAEYRLSEAERALANCRNSYTTDSKGRRHYKNCSGLESRVSAAQADVFAAQVRVSDAEAEVKAALAEQARARARVQCCERAVALSEEAMVKAEKARRHALDALSTAERGLEHAQAADRTLEEVREKVEKEEEECELMLRDSQQAENAVDEAHFHIQNTLRYEESAQRYHVIARADLNMRLAFLRELNRPNLLGAAAYTIPAGIEVYPDDISSSVSSSVPMAVPSKLSSHAPPEDTSDWETLFVNFPLEKLPMPADIQDEHDFHDLPMFVVRDGLVRLQTIQMTINTGQGQSNEFWAARDQLEALSGDTCYQRIYETYYREDAVRVVEEGQQYSIEHGHHRVWLAKHMGISKLPVVLTRRRLYVPGRVLEDTQGNKLQCHTFEEANFLKLRAFDRVKHPKIPVVVEEGELGYAIDIEMEDDFGVLRARIARFELDPTAPTVALAAVLLDQAERACLAQGATSIYLTIPISESRTTALREWYRERGYLFRRQAREALVYKTLVVEQL